MDTQFKPLSVTFELAGAWVPPSYPMHLDGLLAYVITQRELADMETPPANEAELIALAENPDAMPLARFFRDGQWVWMASALIVQNARSHESTFFTSRVDTTALAVKVGHGAVQFGRLDPSRKMAPLAGNIDTTRGTFRGRLETFPTEQGKNGGLILKAWCLGDVERIEELLTDEFAPTHLGKHRASGYGRIRRVTVAPDDAAHERWMDRVRPWALSEDDIPVQAACRAPYWHAGQRGAAWMANGI